MVLDLNVEFYSAGNFGLWQGATATRKQHPEIPHSREFGSG